MTIMTIIYKKLYPWDVVEAVKEGKEVFILDRATNEVYSTNSDEISIPAFVQAITIKDESNRFDFWTVERVEKGKAGKK